MKATEIIKEIFYSKNYNSLPTLLDGINTLLKVDTQQTDKITANLADTSFLDEIRTLTDQRIPIFFGKTLRDLKCIITDEASRDHVIYLQYNGPKKVTVKSTELPYTPLQDQEFTSVVDAVNTFKQHIEDLKGYFHELESIDGYFTVVDPQKATFKEDYRRILLDERTWLHIEVTPEGLATNVHLVGQSEKFQEKLQAGLLQWDHDRDIVENVTAIFDTVAFPSQLDRTKNHELEEEKQQEPIRCSICLCQEIPDLPGLPQPLCQNPLCGMYFHRDCLFQWLVACSGGRPPAFGVATGNCPCCLQSVTCSNKDG